MKANMNMEFKRGDIVMVLLDGCRGSEVAKLRPAIICQNNVGNKFAPTLIILPITHRNVRNQPTQLEIKKWMLKNGSDAIDGIILAEQIRTVDKTRIKGIVGALTPAAMELVDEVVLISMGINMKIEA